MLFDFILQLTAESFVLSSGEGVHNNVAMRGRHDAYSMYKRGTRDYIINAYDKEQGSGILHFTSFFTIITLMDIQKG